MNTHYADHLGAPIIVADDFSKVNLTEVMRFFSSRLTSNQCWVKPPLYQLLVKLNMCVCEATYWYKSMHEQAPVSQWWQLH